MDVVKNMLGSLDWKSQKVKLGVSFIVLLVLFAVLSPGVFFEIDPTNKDTKIKPNKVVPVRTAFTHGFVFSVIILLFIYFYLLK